MISSTSNDRVKYFRKLRDKKEQKRTGLFLMEGLRIIGEAFDTNQPIQTVIFCRDLLKNEYGNTLLKKAGSTEIEIVEVSQTVFESIADKENPQGLLAVSKMVFFDLEDLKTDSGLIIALNEIADPGNLGTIIRTADGVNSAGIILLGDSTNPYDSGAIRASMGALFSQKVVKTSFETFSSWAKKKDLPVIGTSDSSELDYKDAQYSDPAVILMGSERKGLTEEQMKDCKMMVRIPMMGTSDSLNLAIASGVMLYEVYNRQRGK